MGDAGSYIRRETLVSVAINAALSLAFYIAFFGFSGPVAVGGLSGIAFDFIPQSFAITLMSTLVPGALTVRRIAAGTVPPLTGRSYLPRALWRRALALATLAALAAAALAAILPALYSGSVAWTAGATIKIGYGALLAWIVTPIGLRATLQAGAAPRLTAAPSTRKG